MRAALIVIGYLHCRPSRPRRGAFVAAYLLLALVAIIILGPFGLMIFAEHTEFMRDSWAGA